MRYIWRAVERYPMTAPIPLSRGELAAASWYRYLLIRTYHLAGDVARNLAPADPRLWHAVPGDGREVPLRIGSRREGPASLPGPAEFRGELCQGLRDFKWKAVDLQRECLPLFLVWNAQSIWSEPPLVMCRIIYRLAWRMPSAFQREPAPLPWGCPTRLYFKVTHRTKALFKTFLHLISNIYRNVILSPGDLVSKTKGEEQQFSSISDQYQESYFHPLIMTGTLKSTNLWNSTNPHFNFWHKKFQFDPLQLPQPTFKEFLPACLPLDVLLRDNPMQAFGYYIGTPTVPEACRGEAEILK